VPPKEPADGHSAAAFGNLTVTQLKTETEMKNLRPLYALACAFALVGAISGCATDQSAAGKMTDEKITAAVQAMINQHPDVGPPDSVRVQTLDHVVYLSGQVSQGLMKQTAEDVARQTLGVTRVVNNVDVTH
jgi:hypothetical protein